MNKETKQLKNFIHNTLGISKDELKAAILKAAEYEGKAQVKRMFESDHKLIHDTVQRSVEQSVKDLNNRYTSGNLIDLVKSEISKQVATKITVGFKN